MIVSITCVFVCVGFIEEIESYNTINTFLLVSRRVCIVEHYVQCVYICVHVQILTLARI